MQCLIVEVILHKYFAFNISGLGSKTNNHTLTPIRSLPLDCGLLISYTLERRHNFCC